MIKQRIAAHFKVLVDICTSSYGINKSLSLVLLAVKIVLQGERRFDLDQG
jgi:hypothetical protein